jgi:hypothetical protein
VIQLLGTMVWARRNMCDEPGEAALAILLFWYFMVCIVTITARLTARGAVFGSTTSPWLMAVAEHVCGDALSLGITIASAAQDSCGITPAAWQQRNIGRRGYRR